LNVTWDSFGSKATSYGPDVCCREKIIDSYSI